jgi:hypothetical protein
LYNKKLLKNTGSFQCICRKHTYRLIYPNHISLIFFFLVNSTSHFENHRYRKLINYDKIKLFQSRNKFNNSQFVNLTCVVLFCVSMKVFKRLFGS